MRLADIDEQIGRLQTTQEQLIERQMQLRGQIEGFRVRKEVLKARHGAAEASARATEVKGNVSREPEGATT